eukprot:CAMPEP_0197590740 /NCGR_PEP_ID=MMETSP1326-20131121/12182_1 /TAXON_ID=1155430 /ORGANISM="Genus nov. species nov., Strain RCC2288" /LENGTH=52 /DNA_ID=CAMNT_0043155995 /DNA_START=209 /DNA_END=363 /DNA_ORIENTATION=-
MLSPAIVAAASVGGSSARPGPTSAAAATATAPSRVQMVSQQGGRVVRTQAAA